MKAYKSIFLSTSLNFCEMDYRTAYDLLGYWLLRFGVPALPKEKYRGCELPDIAAMRAAPSVSADCLLQCMLQPFAPPTCSPTPSQGVNHPKLVPWRDSPNTESKTQYTEDTCDNVL